MATSNTETAVTPAGADARPGGRVRVLHLSAGNLYGGVETILVTLARLRGLCPSMESEFAVCFEGRLSRELEATGAPVHLIGNVRISRPWTVWRARRRLLEVLAREQYDLVMCHMPWPIAAFGPAIRKSGQRLGMWVHNFHTGSPLLERLARRTPPDLAVACSCFTQTSLANIFPRVPCQVIYPPLDLKPLGDAGAGRSMLRDELDTPGDAVVIVQVSRMEGWKGHVAHLEALAQLKNSSTPWVCWMVGGAQRPEELTYLEQLKSLVQSSGLAGRVRFLGQRSDVSALLDAADIFCQPNLSPEPFGIVFVEALWAGLPVVTFGLGGAIEIVDESCGVLVPPGDVRSLAAGLEGLIEDAGRRSILGRAGRERARRLSDPAAQMDALRSFTAHGNSLGGHA